MANIRNPTSIEGKTVNATATNGIATILSNSDGNSVVYKINSIFAANIDGANSSWISIQVAGKYIAKFIIVPPDSTQIISTKETYFYLENGQSITTQAQASNDVDVVISYEKITG